MALQETVKIIFDIIYELANAPDGLSRAEIAAKYRISASAAHKYIRLIEDMGVPLYTDGQKYHVAEDYFVNLKLTSEEGEFLFLALERALTAHSSQSQIVRTLIFKLARKLHPHLAGELQDRFRQQQGNLEAARIFTTLVQAKKRRREVWVDYHPLNRSDSSRWRIRPFRFVSNPLSDGFYVLCDGSRDGADYISLSLKFDRIQDVRLCDEKFEIVDLARFQSHFGRAWGVWSSGRGEPTTVVLRFERRHYDRLLESAWHPTQRITADADGDVRYSVDVAEPDEMVPWIRSWGSGVVVEEPEELRRRIVRSLKRQVQHYGLTMNDNKNADALHLLWAKRDPMGKPKAETSKQHLLIYHLLDVAAAACCMWDDVLSAGQKIWLQDLLGSDEIAARGQLALLAGLHDIGKATPGFQKKARDRYDALCQADEDLREKHSHVDDHGILSAAILRRWLIDKDIGKIQAGQLAGVIGGHHGSWISTYTGQAAQAGIGRERWQALQDEVIAQLRATLGAQEVRLPDDPQRFNCFAVFLSGFVSICDWIGSNSLFFPYEEEAIDPQEYFQQAIKHARRALNELGFFGWTPDKREPTFEEAFAYLALEANELQRAGIKHLAALNKMPRLILIEYLTGGGKTELALHIGDRLLNRFGLSGAYIAMPTQATSNQMFERVKNYLQMRYEQQNINLQLAHGQAQQQFKQWQAQAESEGNDSGDAAGDWFGENRKRTLLAPFGVGTIDQAMLCVLQAKHHFVRQFALSQKLVIFDEIHSYDSYMNTIIERLFNWLRALNTPLILLSATLSRQGREDILQAVGAEEIDKMPRLRYPRLTVVEHDGNIKVHELPLPETRAVHIQRIPSDLDSLLAEVQPRYHQGGCIAIVCNTVNESIDVARFLREAQGIDADDVWLFHARFPPVWRAEIEDEALAAFGKEAADRPRRKILVATQIIEQSLDLDFDLMVSRVAPIDLLIQRVGRLHRHAGRSRPPHLSEPTLLLRAPEIGEGDVPDFGVDEVIYARFFLLKSWLKLRDMDALRSPDDIDALMDFVYSEEVPVDGISSAYRKALVDAWDELKLDDRNREYRGAMKRIGKPSDESIVGGDDDKLPDDEALKIHTRDIQPGIDIICLVDESLKSLVERKLPPGKENRQEEISTLLKHKVTVRGKIKHALEQLEENRHWQRIAQLKFARAIPFNGDSFEVPNSPFSLRLTKDYGLEIINVEDA